MDKIIELTASLFGVYAVIKNDLLPVSFFKNSI